MRPDIAGRLCLSLIVPHYPTVGSVAQPAYHLEYPNFYGSPSIFSVKDDAQIAGETIQVFNQIKLLQFPHSCGGKLIGWNPVQNKSGLLLREFHSLFDPFQEILVLRADPLAVKTPDQGIVPGMIQLGREWKVARPLVMKGDTPLCAEKKALRSDRAGRTVAKTSRTVLATFHHL